VSDDRIDRLRAVSPSERAGGSREIPVEVLSFATLPPERRELLLQVNDLLQQIAYGTVVIVMHDGHVTQLEASEKIRLREGPSDDR
jgi:hypothetical protein